MTEQQIAFLGWGSLVWNPESLPIRGGWWNDGPILPIEFARQSTDGRLTLVTNATFTPVRALWTIADVLTIEDAITELRRREKIPEKNEGRHIGFLKFPDGQSNISEEFVSNIQQWAQEKNLRAVVWTALPPKFADVEDRIPTGEEAIQYFRDLPFSQQETARNYILRAPVQIDTPYRRLFTTALNWRATVANL